MCNKTSFLVHNPKYKANGEWAEQLGLEVTSSGDISNTAPFYEINVKGVYAVGDCGMQMKVLR
jgi:pyruvate/2-oxoglutarate dehydrogenase complex dihydrolipoamide dehydrogenase (E3) component